MDSSEYQKLKEIFHSASEMALENRTAYLNEKCAGNQRLRSEIERLLASCDSEYLEQPAVESAVELVLSKGLEPGSSIGHYTIVKRIGSGGMGDVYLAQDGKLGRRVAIKILPEMFTEDSDRLGRFLQEARAVSALNHPNILTIHEIGDAGLARYIATEYVDGETLRSRLNRARPSLAEILDIALQCTSALAAAHENGIIHRDIKPENIMIRGDGLVKLLDFGLAKLVERQDSEVSHDALTERHVHTEPGMIMGTVQYMSPEQTRGHATDARTDIWSLGCVIFEMLAGRPPFAGNSTADLIAEIVRGQPVPLSRFVRRVPKELEKIVVRSLEKDAADRYQSAQDLLADLKQIKPNRELAAVPLDAKFRKGRIRSRTDRKPKSTETVQKDLATVSSAEYFIWGIKSHRLTTAALTLFVIGLVAVTAFLVRNYWRSPKEERLAYAEKIRLVAQAVETSNHSLAKQFLEETIPMPGGDDLRGFEWGYLSRLYSETASWQPIILEHHDELEDVAYSPDGKTLATACHDGHVRTWDVSTGDQVTDLPEQAGWVLSVAYSPDGTRLVTTNLDDPAKLFNGSTGSIKVWNTANGAELFTLATNVEASGKALFSADGKLVIAVYSGAVRVWNAETGAEDLRRANWMKGGYPMTISPDGKLIASRVNSQTLQIWNIAADRRITSIDGHTGWINDIEFSRDSRSILTSSKDRTVKLWDVKTGANLRTYGTQSSEVGEVSIAPNGKLAGTGSSDGTVKIWDLESGNEVATLKGHSGSIQALAFSPDSRRIASGGGSADKSLRIWNVPQNGSRGSISAHSKQVNSITFSPDGKFLASSGDDERSAKIWDVESEREYLTVGEHSSGIGALAFSPDSLTLATGGADRKINLWDMGSGRRRVSIDTTQPVAQIVFSPDGRRLASGHSGKGKGVRIWNAETGKLVCSSEGFDEDIFTLAFSKNGDHIITVSGDRKVRKWDSVNCRALMVYNGDGFDHAAYLPNGKLVLFQALNNQRSLKLMDAESGKEMALITGGQSEINSATFSFDGNRLITIGADGNLKIWDVASGQELLTLKGSASELSALGLAPNGTIIAAGGNNGTINIWRADAFHR